MRIANRNAGKFASICKPFKGNNLFGELLVEDVYVVYSYGYHFPLYAKIGNTWYENKDKYSSSTGKHKSQARPSGELIPLNTEQLKDLIYCVSGVMR